MNLGRVLSHCQITIHIQAQENHIFRHMYLKMVVRFLKSQENCYETEQIRCRGEHNCYT
jgi:hypothetical protein